MFICYKYNYRGVCLYALVNEWYPFGGDYECYNNSLADYQNLHVGYHLSEGKHIYHTAMGYYIYCSTVILEFHSLVSSLLTINATTRPLISEIGFHSWMTDCPSIRPSWYDTSDKYTIQTCLPSYLHNVKPRHSCTSQSSSCKNAVAPYAQSSMEDVKDTDLSCGADAGISTVFDDIAEPGEVTCNQVKDVTCASSCKQAEAARIVRTVSFAGEIATNDRGIKIVKNINLDKYASHHTPSDSISLNVKDSVAIESTTDCDEYDRVFRMGIASTESNNVSLSPHADDTVKSKYVPIENAIVADTASTECGIEAIAEGTTLPDTVDSQHHVTSSQGPHKARHFKARIRSAGRRLLSFIQRIGRHRAHQ